MKSGAMRQERLSVFSEALAVICVALVALPIAWMVVQGFLPNRAIVSNGWTFPFWLGNFQELFGAGSPFAREIVNSVVITAGTVLLCVLVGSITGYVLALLHPPRWLAAIALGLSALLPIVPPMVLVPGLYITMSRLDLIGSLLGLILLNTVFNLPFAALLMLNFFSQSPAELREAALVDGASEVGAFLRVMLPLSRPAVSAVGIYTAIMAWNEFLMGLTMTSGGAQAPLTVGIAGLVQPYSVTWGAMAAAGTVAAVPLVVLTIFAGRQIVAGLTAGALKG